ncbi:hypothetical protein AIOL_004131 [Candidatus Rhodobacter oscarellae]|uniref:Copper metallochaperone n=1 Tax=Candidatus Rhodobacter oscarellae TaxID=1675527 RepID=A0A0J9E8Q2_9RHOB|nr:copper chaperone PCu(A)C [Candidatus Rhodobacter lobularis]KMW59150.1 hypothetical protein AIOL_004131 [Candidatus Rhodobacter lobularis]
MELARLLLALGFFGIAALSFLLFTEEPSGITVSDVKLEPMGGGFALLAKIENQGAPDKLLGVGSDAASRVAFSGATGDLAVPDSGTASLAMDGVHGMLMGLQGGTTEGRLVPVTLWFERAGRVAARARISGGAGMSHDALHVVPEEETAPTISMQLSQKGPTGPWEGQLTVENFSFAKDAVDGPHQPGQGHAHLYLNGLKLGRLFTTEFTIGELPAGTYEVVVVLNTNDHRSYATGRVPVLASETITADAETQ